MRHQGSGFDRSKAVQMCAAANQLIADLCAGTAGLRHFSRRPSNRKEEEALKAGQNMCFMHLIITLCKWKELQENERGKYLPAARSNDYKNLRRQFKIRKIQELRNHFAAHLFTKSGGKLLDRTELEDLMRKATHGDIEGFLKWINDPSEPISVISIVEYTRNWLMEKFGVTRNEVIGRAERYGPSRA